MVFQRRQRQWSHVAALIACSVLAVAITLLLELATPSPLEPIELWTLDVRFAFRPLLPVAKNFSTDQSDALVIIDYDDRAARDYGLGRWPWDRRVHAKVIDLIRQAGARSVMVDLKFDFPARDRREDEALVRATRLAGMVIHAVLFKPVSGPAGDRSVPVMPPRHLIQAKLQGAGDLPAEGRLILPLPGLVESAGALGHIQLPPDRGGVLRRIGFLHPVKNGFVPGLALAAALRELEVVPDSLHIELGRAIRLTPRHEREVVIPIDAQGRTWINYAGEWGTRFKHYPYSWILDRLQSPQGRAGILNLFKDKLIVLSNLTTGSGDQVPTPFERNFPTSEVHLHILSMLLTRQFLYDATPLERILGLGLPTLILTAAALSGGPVLIIPTYAAVLGAYLLSVQLLFNHGGVILPAVPPLLALTISLVLLLLTRFLIVDRERIRFQSALGACLPPQTIRVIQESPHLIATLLAGRTRELTVLFADIKAFSAYCKRADPLQIQEVLRDYLSAMTVVLRDHGGTLDKYMGDGIMAFFGDAEPEGGGEAVEESRVERHAAAAVRAGLAMQEKMSELNDWWQSQGREPHLIRIGINTGLVTVGNMGTKYKWDYTVIGPEVNKAQRLEATAEPGGLLLAHRTYGLAKQQGVIPEDLPAKSIMLEGIGKETNIHAVPPELVEKWTARSVPFARRSTRATSP